VRGFENSRLLRGCDNNRFIVVDLDLHYKHEAVSDKISKSYNLQLWLIVTAGISFIK